MIHYGNNGGSGASFFPARATRLYRKSDGRRSSRHLLHGFPDNAGSFRHQLPALAEAGFRAISVTLRGYECASIPENGDYSVEAIASDIYAVIDQLDQGPVHLVGHDWGAAIAYNAAAAAPHILKA
ncbi:MAG: hypothetical protein CM15mP74_19080 [Halieaceae bacterium]|nr:MAG: hypothetical protein CM15mP74_19080 [Halieaceae bacterium]